MATLLGLISDHVIWIYSVCGLIVLLSLRAVFLAVRDRREALFTLEREAATNRAYRAVTIIMIAIAVAGLVTFMDVSVEPMVREAHEREETPTMLLNLTPTFTPAPATPTHPSTRTPTRLAMTPTAALTPTVPPPPPTSPPSPPPSCPNALACITHPGEGARLQGVVEVRGTANIEGFHFYKVEYGIGQVPTNWNAIGALQYTPVEDGTLLTFDTAALADGPYVLRLTVVDNTGNFPEPSQVSVVVANGEG
jgi:hypothetical protein